MASKGKINIPNHEFNSAFKTTAESTRKKRDSIATEIIEILIQNECTINDAACINNRIKYWFDDFRTEINEKTPLQYDQREEDEN